MIERISLRPTTPPAAKALAAPATPAAAKAPTAPATPAATKAPAAAKAAVTAKALAMANAPAPTKAPTTPATPAAAPATPAAPKARTAPTAPDSGLEKALEHIRAILIDGETLDAWAGQCRIFAFTHRRTIVAATTGRFLALRRGLLGGFDVIDLRWQDLKDATIRVGIFGADLTVTAMPTSDLAGKESVDKRYEFTGLQKDGAQQVYRLCQGQEQAWREKRRIRELEEMRARSGGVQIGAGAVPAAVPGEQPADAVTRLQQAKKMLEARLISDAEYEALKARILGGL